MNPYFMYPKQVLYVKGKLLYFYIITTYGLFLYSLTGSVMFY